MWKCPKDGTMNYGECRLWCSKCHLQILPYKCTECGYFMIIGCDNCGRVIVPPYANNVILHLDVKRSFLGKPTAYHVCSTTCGQQLMKNGKPVEPTLSKHELSMPKDDSRDIYTKYMIFARKRGKIWYPPENFFARYEHQKKSTCFVEMGQEYIFENLLKREIYNGVALPLWWCEGFVFSIVPLFYANNRNEKKLDGEILHVAIHFALLPKYRKSAKLEGIIFEIIDVSKKEWISSLIKQIKIRRNDNIQTQEYKNEAFVKEGFYCMNLRCHNHFNTAKELSAHYKKTKHNE